MMVLLYNFNDFLMSKVYQKTNNKKSHIKCGSVCIVRREVSFCLFTCIFHFKSLADINPYVLNIYSHFIFIQYLLLSNLSKFFAYFKEVNSKKFLKYRLLNLPLKYFDIYSHLPALSFVL